MKHVPLLLSMLIIIACQPDSEMAPAKPGKPIVAAVNYPLAEFARCIGGDHIEIHFPEIEGDPAFWKPTAQDIRPFQSADLILLNGANYAKWRQAASLPPAKLLDTSTAFADRFITVKESAAHQHGKSAKHSHAGTAFTTWLDLTLAQKQARAIYDRLIKLLPDKNPELTKNYNNLEANLRDLDKKLKAAAKHYEKTPLLGSHPVYQYLARGYSLSINSVHWEPDTLPDEAGWEELESIIKTHPATLMLWEDDPKKEILDKLNARGIKSLVFNPAGNRLKNKSWIEAMQQNITRLQTAAPKN